jgi:hypothetical protein
VADLRSFDENKWLGFEEKLMGNFLKLLRIRIPASKATIITSSDYLRITLPARQLLPNAYKRKAPTLFQR